MASCRKTFTTNHQYVSPKKGSNPSCDTKSSEKEETKLKQCLYHDKVPPDNPLKKNISKGDAEIDSGSKLVSDKVNVNQSKKEKVFDTGRKEKVIDPAKNEKATIPAKEKATDATKKEKATDLVKNEKTTVSAKKEKATEPAKKEKATEPAKKEKATEPAKKEKTTDSAIKEKATEPAKKEKTTDSAIKEKATGLAIKEDTVDSARKENVIDSSKEEKPTGSAKNQKPSDLENKEKTNATTTKSNVIAGGGRENIVDSTEREIVIDRAFNHVVLSQLKDEKAINVVKKENVIDSVKDVKATDPANKEQVIIDSAKKKMVTDSLKKEFNDPAKNENETDENYVKSTVIEEKQKMSKSFHAQTSDDNMPGEDALALIDTTNKEPVLKKSFVTFRLSIESNSDDEIASSTHRASDSVPDFTHQPTRVSIGKKFSEVSKENSSFPSLRLNLPSSDGVSSPECISSPEIRNSLGRMRIGSGEGSLTATPPRTRRQTFCGISYLSRRNLSRESNLEDLEDAYSESSSDFSPGSTLSSLAADRYYAADEMSDSMSSDGRLRESTDFSDVTDTRSHFEPFLTTPVNRQLRIVTSVDRALHPHRRSSMTSPKILNLGRSSSENLEHIAFIDYLKRLRLGQYLKHFPSSMSLLDFRLATEEELLEVYGIHDLEGRKALLRAIETSREEEESDTDSWVSISLCQSADTISLYKHCLSYSFSSVCWLAMLVYRLLLLQ